MSRQQIHKTFIILALSVFITLPIFVSAATSAGIKPGSIFYFLDTAFEKINLFFTFNPEKKAQKNLEYANERLAEAEAVAEKKNTDAVKTAVAGYESNIALAAEESSQIKDKGKTEELLNSIADNTSKHQEILAEVYNKVPEEAKSAIEKAIEVSTKNHENALKEIEGLKKTVEELQKDIESLKQKGQSDQSKEIEAMRKEIEALKSQKSSQSAQPKIIEKVVEKIAEVPPATSQKPATKLSNSEIIEKVKPAVVYIQTSDGSGSGMIIESNGYVLTNAHVISGVNTAKIKLSDGRLFIGSVVGRDEKIDLALLKINGENFPTVILGDSSVDALKQGDEVFAFGYPFGLEGDVSFKEGTISRRQIYEGTTYLETSAQIHPGNSGGPLVNRYAQVIGINTQSVGTGVSGVLVGETIKFALPINLARGLIPDLKSGRNVVLPKITLPLLPNPSLIPTPQPLPTPEPTPSPSCTKDTWSCSDWSECSTFGSQTRACNIIFDCSVANTPSPDATQNCTPPSPSTEIVQTSLSENVSNYTFYNRTNKYIGYTSARVKVWQSKIINPHEYVRVEISTGQGLVSPLRSDSGTGSQVGNFTVLASTITGTSEETATMITVPLPNELNLYCNSCGHMVIPTARANNPKDVAAYIHLETHADGVDNPNDRYFIKLISFEGETFGTKETQTVMGTVYTF